MQTDSFADALLPGEIPQLHAVGITTRKRRGEIAEAAFLAKAASLGFGVAKPWGDSERYDFIIDSGLLARPDQIHPTLRRVPLSRENLRLESNLYSRRDRLHHRLHCPREPLVRRSHCRCRIAQRPALLSPRRTQRASGKISRSLVPDGLPSPRKRSQPDPRPSPLPATRRPPPSLSPLLLKHVGADAQACPVFAEAPSHRRRGSRRDLCITTKPAGKLRGRARLSAVPIKHEPRPRRR